MKTKKCFGKKILSTLFLLCLITSTVSIQTNASEDINETLLQEKMCDFDSKKKLHEKKSGNKIIELYDETGRVKVNDNIPALSQVRAQNLLNLANLQRYPGKDNPTSPKDFRWAHRIEAWTLASRYKERYLNGAITEDDIICLAKLKGQWSIWFTVFKGIDSVRARLISDFPGTCASCFDENNHFEPIERNPGKPDPV